MAYSKSFGWTGFFLRLLFAICIVFASYNPEGYSYYSWVYDALPSFTVFKAFVGIILLIAWVVLIRATLSSLGFMGIILAAAFFGLAIWLVIEQFGLSTNSSRVISYIIEVMFACVLSIGVSWSHVRRRITGQVDTDELNHNA